MGGNASPGATPRKGKTHMKRQARSRSRIVVMAVGVLAAGAAVIAVGASANFRSVHDPRGDVKCRGCSDSVKRNADIVRRRRATGTGG
jgi:hypothetical protein